MSSNEEFNKEFFNRVKGKKIWWRDWNEDDYFIPTSRTLDLLRGQMYSTHNSSHLVGYKDVWYIACGFKIRGDRNQYGWKMFESETILFRRSMKGVKNEQS